MSKLFLSQKNPIRQIVCLVNGVAILFLFIVRHMNRQMHFVDYLSFLFCKGNEFIKMLSENFIEKQNSLFGIIEGRFLQWKFP